jgi:hypothetical protein
LAGQSPKEALDAFVDRFRAALRCVAVTEVRGSGHAVGRLSSITLIPHGGRAGNVLPLRTTDGRRDLQIGIRHHYTIIHLPDDLASGPFKVSSSRYMYELLDRDERELFVYHWHPEGVSPIQTPHLHFSGAAPLPLPLSPSDQQPRQIAVDRAHFPTGRIAVESFIELLIQDFQVEPRRTDWREILGIGLLSARSTSPWE